MYVKSRKMVSMKDLICEAEKKKTKHRNSDTDIEDMYGCQGGKEVVG